MLFGQREDLHGLNLMYNRRVFIADRWQRFRPGASSSCPFPHSSCVSIIVYSRLADIFCISEAYWTRVGSSFMIYVARLLITACSTQLNRYVLCVSWILAGKKPCRIPSQTCGEVTLNRKWSQWLWNTSLNIHLNKKSVFIEHWQTKNSPKHPRRRKEITSTLKKLSVWSCWNSEEKWRIRTRAMSRLHPERIRKKGFSSGNRVGGIVNGNIKKESHINFPPPIPNAA